VNAWGILLLAAIGMIVAVGLVVGGTLLEMHDNAVRDAYRVSPANRVDDSGKGQGR
jgi:hypothetical protein